MLRNLHIAMAVLLTVGLSLGWNAEPADDVYQALVEAGDKHGDRKGDELLESYVRRAAQVAAAAPKEKQSQAFLDGLARALMDDRLGHPTMRGRADLTKHFFVSANLANSLGAKQAEAIGLTKEQIDAIYGSGFSFSDLLADLAGIAFTERLQKGKIKLGDLADHFTVKDHLPDPRMLRLEDGLSAKQFAATYGSLTDQRFQHELKRIRAMANGQ